jgi:hypothetical protein
MILTEKPWRFPSFPIVASALLQYNRKFQEFELSNCVLLQKPPNTPILLKTPLNPLRSPAGSPENPLMFDAEVLVEQ